MVWVSRGLLIAALAAVAVYAVLWMAAGAAGDFDAFRLREIHFAGLKHVDVKELEQLIRGHFPENVLAVDLDDLRALVESEGWVDSAVVRRKLPDEIFVYVKERQPSAVAVIDGEMRVVDAQGVVLAPNGPRFQNLDRPIVKGLQNVARENAKAENADRMKAYLKILSELEQADAGYPRSISEIDVSDPQRVAVVPNVDPVQVYLGDRDFARRYKTFLSRLDLYRELKSQHGSIESVDVTYDDKIIIHTPESPSGGQVKRREPS